MLNRTRLMALTATASMALSSLCLAQLVLPPVAPPPESDPSFEMPPKPIAPPVATPINPSKPKPEPIVIPEGVKYTSLVERDAEGKLIPLAVPTDWAALKNNTLLDDAQRPAIEKYLAERKAHLRTMVAQNLDLIEEIENGALNKLNADNLADRKNGEMQRVTNIARPLMPPKSAPDLAKDLTDKGLFTPVQGALHKKITKEYADALLKDANAADKSQTLVNTLRSIFNQGLEETRTIHQEMLAAAAAHADDLAAKGVLSDSAIAKALNAIDASAPLAAKAKAASDALASLSLDQRKAIMTSLAEMMNSAKN
ncbi:MAG: hypothetical protein AB7Q00_02805 [Phycisphaerales bacterium]